MGLDCVYLYRWLKIKSLSLQTAPPVQKSSETGINRRSFTLREVRTLLRSEILLREFSRKFFKMKGAEQC